MNGEKAEFNGLVSDPVAFALEKLAFHVAPVPPDGANMPPPATGA
jgi:hypothetical protein